jgi:hypothetical protein
MTSPSTLLNSTVMNSTSEKDKESLIKALRDRINLKRLTIIKFIFIKIAIFSKKSNTNKYNDISVW